MEASPKVPGTPAVLGQNQNSGSGTKLRMPVAILKVSATQKRTADDIYDDDDDDDEGDITKRQKIGGSAPVAVNVPNGTTTNSSAINKVATKRKSDLITEPNLDDDKDDDDGDGGDAKKQKTTGTGIEIHEPELQNANQTTPQGTKRPKVDSSSSTTSNGTLQTSKKQINKAASKQNILNANRNDNSVPYEFGNFYFTEQVGEPAPMLYRIREQKCLLDSCSKTFREHEFLIRHLNEAHKTYSYKCLLPGCGKTFISRPGLKYHIKYKHRNLTHWPCGKCEIPPFSSHFHLFKHSFDYHQEGLFECIRCDFNGKTRGKVVDHHQKFHETRGLKRKGSPGPMMTPYREMTPLPPFDYHQEQQYLQQQNSYLNAYRNSGEDHPWHNLDSTMSPKPPANNGYDAPNKKRKYFEPQNTHDQPGPPNDPYQTDRDDRTPPFSSSMPPNEYNRPGWSEQPYGPPQESPHEQWNGPPYRPPEEPWNGPPQGPPPEPWDGRPQGPPHDSWNGPPQGPPPDSWDGPPQEPWDRQYRAPKRPWQEPPGSYNGYPHNPHMNYPMLRSPPPPMGPPPPFNQPPPPWSPPVDQQNGYYNPGPYNGY